MGKSFRKAILKDKGNSDYNKIIRRVNNSIVKNLETSLKVSKINDYIHSDDVESFLYEWDKLFDLENKIKDGKEIVNQYDICDYKWNIEYNNDSWAKQRDLDKDKIKYRRK